jgi:3-deoxy-D-arabino-heptulosonate 7-phosphate (DAHP) synthase class II
MPTTTVEGGDDKTMWVLRQLRPVSYNFKAGPDHKAMRFGFVADEVEETMPNIMRQSNAKGKDAVYGVDEMKGIMYQDLIAVLVAGMQAMSKRVERVEAELQRRVERDEAELQNRSGLETRIMQRLQAIEDALMRKDASTMQKGRRASSTV